MFQSFYLSRRWLPWAFPGGALILFATWYKVELDVKINEWFGDFYNLIQKALGRPNAITMGEYMEQLATFGYIAGLYVAVAVFTDFFIKHYVFRWRTAMTDYYAANWHTIRGIEGASQRVQEDTMRFARLMEGLGVSFMRSVMTLFAFLPILWTLSEKITELPWIGSVSHSLVWVAIIFALAGTVLMAVVGIKLPGLEFENQRVEAAFRKELVYGEDDGNAPARRGSARCSPTCGGITSACSFITCISTWPDTPICSSACWFPISPSGLPWWPASSRSGSCSRSFAPSAGWRVRSSIW